jgi:ribose transport system substrate-binding protein
MRKFRILAIVLTLALGLALIGGCSSSNKPAASTANKTYTIGFSNASSTDAWLVYMLQTMNYQASQYKNLKLITTDANNDASKQMSDAEDLIAQKVDALVILPSVVGALAPVIDKAHAVNIPVVVANREIGATTYDAFCFTSGVTIGQDMGNYAVQEFKSVGDKANIVYISGFSGAGADNDRTEGLHDALAAYPGMKIVAQQAGNWDESTSMTVMENLLQANSKIDLLITSDGNTAVGALRAIKAANRTGIKILSMDASRNDSYQNIEDGVYLPYTAINPCYVGGWSLKVAYDILNGKKVLSEDKICPVPTVIITKDNVSQYYDKSLGATSYTWKALYAAQLKEYYDKEVA